MTFRSLLLGFSVLTATPASAGGIDWSSAPTVPVPDRPPVIAVAYPAAAPVLGRPVVRARRRVTVTPIAHAPEILSAAHANGVDPWLLASVIQVESASRANAVSAKGARGLMQLTPSTARSVGVSNPDSLFDPEVNVSAGARQLRVLHAQFGRLPLVLAAYNAGEGAVRRYGGIPPYAETTAYVVRVLARYRAHGGHA